MIGRSAALRALPEYPFVRLEAEARAWRGPGSLLRFSIGDPDLPPWSGLRRAAERALGSSEGNRYSSSRGEPTLRAAIARYMDRRFGVPIDPDREVVVLIGSKEGLSALPRAILEPGDRIGVPDPGYPVYENAARLGGFRPVPVPLRAEARWQPDWEAIPEDLRLLYLNYPNNPTGAVARPTDLARAVEAAHDRRFTIAFDNAYSEFTFDGTPAPSILSIGGAREVAVEFHSFSKTFGVPGWRIGFAVGPPDAVDALAGLKGHADSGAPNPLQRAVAEGLEAFGPQGWSADVLAPIEEYHRRLNRLAEGLRSFGIAVDPPKATLYLWHRAPGGDGRSFAERLLREAGVLVTPGEAFGAGGRGYVRWSATIGLSEIDEALVRLARCDPPIGTAPARLA